MVAQIWVFYILAPSPSSVCEFGEEGERDEQRAGGQWLARKRKERGKVSG